MQQPRLSRQEFAKSFFGRKHSPDIWRAIICYTVEPPEKFYGQSIFDGLKGSVSESPSQISEVMRELYRLEELGMVHRGEKEGAAVPYTRTDSPMWHVVEVALETVDLLYPIARQA